MKRSLINLLFNMILSLLVLGTFTSVTCGEEWNWYRPSTPRPAPLRTSSIIRAQLGTGGYSTPSLSPQTPSYAPAQYAPSQGTTPSYAPAYTSNNAGASPAANGYTSNNAGTSSAANSGYTSNNAGTNSGWKAPNAANSGYTPAAGAYQQSPAAGTTAASVVPQNNQTNQGGYQEAPTSRAIGDEPFPWIDGTGPPPPVTGDAAGQGGYLPNWGGPDGGQIYAPESDESYYNRLFGGPPNRAIPLTVTASETQTGRLMFGVGVNSDAGLIGSIVLDEQNFDWRRFPRSFEEIRNASAWRGAGQRFRLEAVPGTEVQRYMATFQEPYLFGSRVSLGLSGNYYTRIYRDWDEDRVGGSVRLGYHLTHSLTGSIGFRGARVDIYDIADPAPQELTEVKGRNSLYGFEARLAHDTRDSTFMPTEGHLIEVGAEQVVGTWDYPKIDLDVRQYFMLHERPDGSGRHVLSLSYRVGWAGDDTPIYDHYFAGGFSTIRGFDYRGASPCDPATGVFVGGQFQMLASAEYLFPITADDMLRGVIFCDTGTVERTIDKWEDKYRVAPGFGLRITVPAMGPAPIALDFAFPVVKQDTDWTETFSFFVGLTR